MVKNASKKRATPEWKKLVREIAEEDAIEAVEASKRLADLRSRSSLRPLTELLWTGKTPNVRELACYALACMHYPQLTSTFIECLQNVNEAENVRSQAAEALGMLYGNAVKRSSDYRSAEAVLLTSLSDSSPAVRFWCCFALGCMKSKRAMKQLSRLKSSDKSLYPGWWFVREEASDALDMIQGRIPPDRVAYHLRETEPSRQTK